MATEDCAKSPSSREQKEPAHKGEKVMWEDVVEQAAEQMLNDWKKKSLANGKPSPDSLAPIETKLSDLEFVKDLRTNTLCKKLWHSMCKGGRLAALHRPEVGIDGAPEIIRWALKCFEEEGNLPGTRDQKNSRERDEALTEKEELQIENKFLKFENFELRDENKQWTHEIAEVMASMKFQLQLLEDTGSRDQASKAADVRGYERAVEVDRNRDP